MFQSRNKTILSQEILAILSYNFAVGKEWLKSMQYEFGEEEIDEGRKIYGSNLPSTAPQCPQSGVVKLTVFKE